jgi:hypothetical protein
MRKTWHNSKEVGDPISGTGINCRAEASWFGLLTDVAEGDYESIAVCVPSVL